MYKSVFEDRVLKPETMQILSSACLNCWEHMGTVHVDGLIFSVDDIEGQVAGLMAVPKEDLPRLVLQNPAPDHDIGFHCLRGPVYRWRLQHETDL